MTRLEPIRDRELLAYANDTLDATATEFRLGFPGPVRLVYGPSPKFVHHTTSLIVLQRGCDWHQLRRQVAHEAVHFLACPPGVYHWAHEMLAECWTIDWLAQQDDWRLAEHADTEVWALLRRSHRCSLDRLARVNWKRPPCPTGAYGRVYVLGWRLSASIGWPAVKELVWFTADDGSPDLAGWLRWLGPRRRAQARRVLGPLVARGGPGDFTRCSRT